MNERIPVAVSSGDPVLRAGIVSELRARHEVWVVQPGDPGHAEVAIIAADEVDADVLGAAKALHHRGYSKIVLVVARLDDSGLLSAVEAGICGLVRRNQAMPEHLVAAVRSAAAGEGTVPPDLLGRLLDQVGRLQRQVLTPRGITFTGLTSREVCVLKLVAEGHDTSEIAERLSYSQRTIKNVLHDLTTRLNLRNRTHAVAYAIREGLI
jgi:DNA-binding NarL/FixJ family response regulator